MKQFGNSEAIDIAFGFFKGNVALSLAAAAVLVIVALLSRIPIAGVIFAFGYTILSLEIQVYVARHIPDDNNSDEIDEIAEKTRLGDFLSRYLDVAAGGFIGFFLITLLLVLLFAMVLDGFSGIGNTATMLQSMLSVVGGTLALLLLLLLFWFGYLLPGVTGEVLMSDGFGPAFKASLLFFSPRFWKRTLNKHYFVLVAIWSVIVFFAALILGFFFQIIWLLPIGLIGAYFLSLYNAALYRFARERLSSEA